MPFVVESQVLIGMGAFWNWGMVGSMIGNSPRSLESHPQPHIDQRAAKIGRRRRRTQLNRKSDIWCSNFAADNGQFFVRP
jgi:hypothetical protein